jgi:hypothetical protein
LVELIKGSKVELLDHSTFDHNEVVSPSAQENKKDITDARKIDGKTVDQTIANQVIINQTIANQKINEKVADDSTFQSKFDETTANNQRVGKHPNHFSISIEISHGKVRCLNVEKLIAQLQAAAESAKKDKKKAKDSEKEEKPAVDTQLEEQVFV